MSLENYSQVLQAAQEYGATLVAVSKTYEWSDIQPIYDSGQRILGENKVQEILRKKESLPEDIEWHLIGHLQSNKAKKIVGQVSLIQSVDSLKLLNVLQNQSDKKKVVTRCLLQIHIAQEESKSGMDTATLQEILSNYDQGLYPHIKLEGLMGMGTLTSDQNLTRKEYQELRRIYESCQKHIPDFTTLSMGMSSDYKIALDQGSTMIRVGSLIFGNRNYT